MLTALGPGLRRDARGRDVLLSLLQMLSYILGQTLRQRHEVGRDHDDGGAVIFGTHFSDHLHAA